MKKVKLVAGVAIPAHLKVKKKEEQILKTILSTKPAENWTPPDVSKAVYLARAQATIEQLNSELEKEGHTIENEEGRLVINPKHSLIEQLTRREIALSKAVHVHAEATQGRARDSIGAKGLKKIAAEKATQSFAPMRAPEFKVMSNDK